MITPMKKIAVYAMRTDRKAVMECLQRSGCVELENMEGIEGLSGVDVKEQKMSFERYMASAKQSLAVLDEISPEKSAMFSDKESISIDYFSLPADEVEKSNRAVFDILSKSKQLHDNEVLVSQLSASIEAFERWRGLDVPMNLNTLKSAEIALYTVNAPVSVELLDRMLSNCPGVYYEIISSDKDISCVWFMFLRRDSKTVHSLIRENGFIPPAVSLSHRTPADKITHIREKIQKINNDNEKIKQELAALCGMRKSIKLFYDYMQLRRDKYENLEKLAQTGKTFILNGFVPEKLAEGIKQRIEGCSVSYVEITDVPEDETAPVEFVNNGFARPVEDITRTYSMPSKTDIDPNAIMAFFYYLFFGMMFSDAGYGILVMLVTGWLAFVKKYKKNFMSMFFFCGVSTTFWGFMYGSFFGDVIYRFSYTFLGKDITLTPIWIDPVKEPLLLLIFSVALGLVQILVGLCINFYVNWRSGKRIDAVCDTGSWIFILLGICLIAAAYGLKISILSTVGTTLAVIGVATVILMKGRDNKNFIMRILSGIIGLYDVTSFVSDALSYSRLMALGLSTGVIAQVVNIMGSLAGKSVVGFIMFVLVFIGGHALNFAINMLGAYVHTNRLQYVEFYSKFYEGGGREFTPLKMNTDYFEFTEDSKI